MLHTTGVLTSAAAKPILIGIVILAVVAVYGYADQHQRQPDQVVCQEPSDPPGGHGAQPTFAGTYMAYLVLQDASDPNVTVEYVKNSASDFAPRSKNWPTTTPKRRTCSPADKILVDAAMNKITKAALEKLSGTGKPAQLGGGHRHRMSGTNWRTSSRAPRANGSSSSNSLRFFATCPISKTISKARGSSARAILSQVLSRRSIRN